MHADRLTLLADKLDLSVPPQKFDLQSWFGRSFDEDRSDPCGFSGCAIGHACQMPEFNSIGLNRSNGNNPVYIDPAGDGLWCLYGWKAVQAVFSLEVDEAFYLFEDSCYEAHPTPADVAARIREVVAGGFPDPIPFNVED